MKPIDIGCFTGRRGKVMIYTVNCEIYEQGMVLIEFQPFHAGRSKVKKTEKGAIPMFSEAMKIQDNSVFYYSFCTYIYMQAENLIREASYL